MHTEPPFDVDKDGNPSYPLLNLGRSQINNQVAPHLYELVASKLPHKLPFFFPKKGTCVTFSICPASLIDEDIFINQIFQGKK